MPFQRLMTDEALLKELGGRIAQQRLDRNLSQAQLAEQAGISKRTLERLEAGAAATQLSLFLRVLRQLDLLERLDLLLPEPQPYLLFFNINYFLKNFLKFFIIYFLLKNIYLT